MDGVKSHTSLALALALMLHFATLSLAWNTDGHSLICDMAKPLLSAPAMAQVNTLMNSQFPHNFTTMCTWGTEVQYYYQYSWSPPLHFITVPDGACDYNYTRDCVGVFGEPNMCASGAIKNYTAQLVDPNTPYNRTEALFFLSNLMGEIHQPLHVGNEGDGNGAFIDVWWMDTRNASKTSLFSVWDSVMIHEAYERQYNQSTPTYNETLVDILGNMSIGVAGNLSANNNAGWTQCPPGPPSCPDVYAGESIQLSCQYAYANVTAGQILDEGYFSTRLPVVYQRLQQAAVRLASTLNIIFAPVNGTSQSLAGTLSVGPGM